MEGMNMPVTEEQLHDKLLIQARSVYRSYTRRVKGMIEPEWENKLMIGEFDQQHGVQIALEALKSVKPWLSIYNP
jgi:hypothetical protein